MADKNTVKFNKATNTEPAFRCTSDDKNPDDKNQNTERFRAANFSSRGFNSIIFGQGRENDGIHHNLTVAMSLSDGSAISTSYDSRSADDYNEAFILRLLGGYSHGNPQDAAESFRESGDDDDDILDEYLDGIRDELDIYWQKGCSFMTRNEDLDIGRNDRKSSV